MSTLFQVEEVELVDKKGYLTVSISFGKEHRMHLRKPEGIREWYHDVKGCADKARAKRGAVMKSTKEFWSKKQFTDSSSMEQWVQARRNIGKSA